MSIEVLSYEYGNAAANPGCKDGPNSFKQSTQARAFNSTLHFNPPITSKDTKQQQAALPAVASLAKQLAQQSFTAAQNHQLLLTLGGDNSCSIGTWFGVMEAIKHKGRLGLIWLDAHLDSHTFDTTPSNNIHGMPLACLLGYGSPELIDIYIDTPRLHPEDIVVIGARSYESGEYDLLRKNDVRIISAEEVRRDGMQAVMQEALSIVSANTYKFGMTLDLDCLDPEDAPGVGTPEKNGIKASDLLSTLPMLAHDPKFCGAEICEFNPHLDKDSKTLNVISKTISSLFC